MHPLHPYPSKKRRFPVISLLPKDRPIIRESVRRFPLIGIRQKVLKGTVAKYSIYDRRLAVSFHCPGGFHLFVKKKKVKKFLGRNIVLPPEVGQQVIYQRRSVVNEVSCQSCGFSHSFQKRVIVVGTVDQATGPIHIADPSWSIKCPHCLSQTTCTVRSV